MDATISRRTAPSVVADRSRLERDVKMRNANPQLALAASIGKLEPVELAGTQGAVMPPTSRDSAEVDKKCLELFEELAEMPKTSPVALSQDMAILYPPAFDLDVVRWVPVIIPLLGVCMVLLTGAMWTLA